ncbi:MULTISPECIES: lipopolysaccharide assembly protein LapB [Nostoc]|uniref:Tetratricopeptide repeat protein n=1 Tax=Nostoc paludosum FACHB-159 TaxID=2692908 RepID=A0ABR8KPI7_9NOSO|nr:MULTISPECIES: hypothetical protein [Nostoc]MBD2683313.1 hypothetical protein [Nostoc sp. FACHB-857]MBD2739617.1 hypothetical protein [Nostoc paludosum FACHB-159]
MLSLQNLTNGIRKKKFPVQVVAIVSISTPLISGSSSAWGQSQLIALRQCINADGKVISKGDRYLPPGSSLCPGDKIHPDNGATVTVICYLNRKTLYIDRDSASDPANQCARPQLTEVEKYQCTNLKPQNCPTDFKGSADDDTVPKPRLISPYISDGSILTTQPLISWRVVPGATSYTVKMEGNDVNWQIEVNNTVLPYPSGQPRLKFGSTYTIIVFAYQGKSIISYAPLVISILPEKEQLEIASLIKQINELKIPPDEAAARDLDTIYMSKNLVNESIETLKVRVAAGSQNPKVYRVLGDRYLEAGLSDEAFNKYATAKKLAKSSKNLKELSKVQEGLKLWEFITNYQRAKMAPSSNDERI